MLRSNVLTASVQTPIVQKNSLREASHDGPQFRLEIADAAFATGIVFTALLSLLAYFSRKSLEQKNELNAERAVRDSLSSELHETELAIEEVITSASEPVLAVDPSGDLIWMNSAAQELLGFEVGHASLKNVSEVFEFPDPIPNISLADLARRGEIDSVIRCKGDVELSRTVFVSTSQSGQDPTFLLTIRDTHQRRLSQKAMEGIIRALKKSQAAALNILDDLSRERKELQRINARLTEEINERKNIEQKLLSVNSELQQKNGELDAFAYVASHDLKEPLRGIHNYSKFLLEDYGAKLDDESRQRLTTVTKLTTRLDSLIDHLLHYSRLGRSKLALEVIQLDEVLGGVTELLEQSLSKDGSCLIVEAPLGVVRGDRVLLTELYQNLVSNALKYSKGSPEIKVGISSRPEREVGEQVTCYVSDNGIGIAERNLEDIFRIFKRLHGREEYGGGAGAGLTISRKIVERHGGVIWAESEPGKGTTFFFTLPKAQS